MLTAQDRSSLYRNDELLDLIDRTFNTGEVDFFTTVAFECKKKAALSWTLNREDVGHIVGGFWKDAEHKEVDPDVGRRLAEIRAWFGNGGR